MHLKDAYSLVLCYCVVVEMLMGWYSMFRESTAAVTVLMNPLLNNLILGDNIVKFSSTDSKIEYGKSDPSLTRYAGCLHICCTSFFFFFYL